MLFKTLGAYFYSLNLKLHGHVNSLSCNYNLAFSCFEKIYKIASTIQLFSKQVLAWIFYRNNNSYSFLN